jgi:multidrug efflux system membrane fusion protein
MTTDLSNKRARRLWLVGGLAAVSIASVVCMTAADAQRSKKAGANDTVPVTVAVVTAQDVPVVLTALGTVQASNTVTISPMVTGPITAINFTEGQDVKAGDVLAQIDPRTYQATLDQDRGKLAQDQATLAGAERDLARYNQLAQSAYTPKQTADDERATVAESKAQIIQDQAAIESAQTQLSYTTLTAPVAGRVGLRNVDLGNIVQAGASTGIVTLTTIQPIAVVFTLPQQNLPAIVDAMAVGKPPVSVSAEGNDTATGPLETGALDVIDNQVDSTTGTVKLKAYFANKDLHLWPGGFVTARLTVKVLKGVLTIPPAAVQTGPTSSFVYTIGTDGKAVQKTVTLGQQSAETVVIESGLVAGEQVVLEGGSRLNTGSKVKIVPATARAKTTAAAPPAAATPSPAQ